jgi:nucleotide-binding universal stress UspA family protein
MPSAFQRLLLATEHTEFDAGAESVAMALARKHELVLAAVVPLLSNPEFEAQAPALAARADQDAASKIVLLKALAGAQGVALDLRARHGPEPYSEIVDEARERRSDLIVIRRRGKRSFLANLLLGEMVFKVVAHAPCSVLIVPREARLWRTRVLVAAEPGARGEKIAAAGAAIAAECGLPLGVVCVSKDEPLQRQAADRFIEIALAAARQTGVTAQGEVLQGRAFEQILQAAKRQEADLLVIGSHDRSRISHAWIGGVAQKLIGLAEHPVLIAHIE